MRIKIATDSTADIPVSLREQLNITVLPIAIIAGDKEYKEGYDITPEEFYPLLETEEKLPTTAQVTPYLYTELFEETWRQGYTHIIQVTLNSKGSATWQNAVNMREQFYEDHPEAKGVFHIHVVDSRSYSMGYGMAVIHAAKMSENGEPVENILAYLEDWFLHVRVMFVPMNLRCVKKSGRISAAAAFIGDAVGLKPVIAFEDGVAQIMSKVRGKKKAVSELMRIMQETRKPGTPYALARGNNVEEFELLKRMCAEENDIQPEVEFLLGCAICVNAGADSIGVIYYS